MEAIQTHFPDVHCPQCNYLVQPKQDTFNPTIECICQDCGCHFSQRKFPNRLVTTIIRSGEKVAALSAQWKRSQRLHRIFPEGIHRHRDRIGLVVVEREEITKKLKIKNVK